MKIRMRKRCDIPHSASHFQKSLIIASWLLTFLFTGTAFAQENRTIKGIVRDVTGEPLIGASVIQKGTNNGVITDVDGNFTLTVPADATLSIAYMGYATREINLAKRKKQGDLKITLSEDTQQLKEVVVTAMGIKKDTKRVGYAISTISADELVKAGAPNFASAMYGKAPGVRITQTQGGSAGAVSINVRGLTSITGNNQPLIILDGVPIRNGGTGESTAFCKITPSKDTSESQRALFGEVFFVDSLDGQTKSSKYAWVYSSSVTNGGIYRYNTIAELKDSGVTTVGVWNVG